MGVGTVPKEREYRFRIKEHDRFIILKALEDFLQGWYVFIEAYKDPSKLEAMRRMGHVPSKETVNWATEETKRLISRLQKATKGRAKRTSDSTFS
jgi:hypothetical protein